MKIIECPRDAMQGIKQFIPTETKAAYINQLLKVGFDTLDFGSFVSPKAIPQMADTAELLTMLDLSATRSKLLAIVANERGAKEAASFPEIDYLGFPLSLSETFQQRNTNQSIDMAFSLVEKLQEICSQHDITLVTYLSMGFGNPYNDPYNADYVKEFVFRLQNLQVTIVSLSDTIGVAGIPAINSFVKEFVFRLQNLQVTIVSLSDTIGVASIPAIKSLFTELIPAFPALEFGAHLHAHPAEAKQKIEAAWHAGCRRFDGALKGFGGCPMADDDLVGNMATETIIAVLQQHQVIQGLDKTELDRSLLMAGDVFPLNPL